MAEAARQPEQFLQQPVFELREAIAPEARCLTEVNHLNRNRLPNGEIDPWAKEEVFKNLVSAVKEAGIPNSVHRSTQPRVRTGEFNEGGEEINAYMWFGRTAVQNAESGRYFHRHESALDRVEVEVDEARYSQEELKPGVYKIFISPRMSVADASHSVAKSEHLAHDDAIRGSQIITDEDGNIKELAIDSLLVTDIPLEAWVDLCEDPENIFGKAIQIEDKSSALSVMKAHRKMTVEAGVLKEGVVSIVAAVIPYIKDLSVRKKVEKQLERFREDQKEIDAKARNIAGRWLEFETELADSLYHEKATPAVMRFINSMQDKWNDDDLGLILQHQLPNAQYEMSQELAIILERAKENFFWTRAGVVTYNQRVIKQMDVATANIIRRDEMSIQAAYENGQHHQVQILEMQTDKRIANENISVGGGCPGEIMADFKTDKDGNPLIGENAASASSYEKRIGKRSKGKCQVDGCPTRPREVTVGGCGVCLERCQKLFDNGEDPTKMGFSRPKKMPKPVFKGNGDQLVKTDYIMNIMSADREKNKASV